VFGQKSLRLRSIPFAQRLDIAVICTRAETVPEIVDDLRPLRLQERDHHFRRIRRSRTTRRARWNARHSKTPAATACA
jgi:hypothetical protein